MVNNFTSIIRKKSTRIYVGKVPIGDCTAIAVQSMLNTRTTNIEASIKQINALEDVGVDIGRIAVPTLESAEAFKIIKKQVRVPLVAADIHFDYRIVLKVVEYQADCLRIN